MNGDGGRKGVSACGMWLGGLRQGLGSRVVAFIVMTAEEEGVVLQGFLEDPTYRPHPGSRCAEWEDQEFDRLSAGGDAQPEPDFGEPPSAFPRSLATRYWGRYAVDLGLLVSRTGPTESDLQVVAFARVEGGPKARRVDGMRSGVIGPWVPLEEPSLMDEIAENLTTRERSKLKEVLGGLVRPLPPGLGTSVERALRESGYPYDDLKSELTQVVVRERTSRASLEVHDANATALSFLALRWRSLNPLTDFEPPDVAIEVQATFLAASEDDYVTDDADRFPGWEQGPPLRRGWRAFEHGGRRMYIKNINASTAESTSGADLVYVRTEPDAVVLVQYKKLRRRATGESYLPWDRRLPGQLKRMLAFKSDDSPPPGLADHRIGEGFAFVKFIDDQEQRGLAPGELTRGTYLPASYVQQMLKGKRKGNRSHDVRDEREITAGTFAGLVRDGWIGSRGSVTKVLASLVKAPEHLTFAIETPSPSSDR